MSMNLSNRVGCKLLIKISEAAILLSMSERKLWCLAKGGVVPSFKIGNSRFFSVAELEKWIASQYEGGAA